MKKAAIINDLSGIGRCSLNVAISILSTLEIQACPLPTAILSNQTGFEHFSFLDFTPHMKDYYSHWKDLGYEFDAIYSGFLGSKEQVEILLEFIKAFKKKKTLVLIDPVMGDNGELYSVYDTAYPEYMKQLVGYADVITPNMTELALLTGIDLSKEASSIEKILDMKPELLKLGPKKIVITGIINEASPNEVINVGLDLEADTHFVEKVGYNQKSYSGTGDIFASILCGTLTQGLDFEKSVQVATQFISKAIAFTEKQKDWDTRNGICFEAFLKELRINETV